MGFHRDQILNFFDVYMEDFALIGVSAGMARKSGFGQASWQYYFCYKIWSNSVKSWILDKMCENDDLHVGKN